MPGGGLPTGFPVLVPSPRVRGNWWLSPRTGAAWSPEVPGLEGRWVAGPGPGSLCPPRLPLRGAAAGQAVSAPLRHETAQRSSQGELFPRISAATS